jgi:superfamily II DNA or RNA helicase
MNYGKFLSAKARVVRPVGFKIADEDISDRLYGFQRDIVRWACRLGRAAIFADCGMGKTLQQLEWSRLVCVKTKGAVLVLAPLAVAKQTIREAERFGIAARYLRHDDGLPGIVVANYEMLQHFDVSRFAGIVLDESSILKAYDGKTRTQIIESFRATPYRLACTATPAPNDFMELGNHAEFLGVMSRPEMLATFFVHDGGDTSEWRIKGHAEKHFWKWVCGWAVMVRRPSDIGHDDRSFILPPLSIHQQVANVDHRAAWSSGTLFAMDAQSLHERRAARRGTLEERARQCVELVATEPNDQWLIWCDLNAEGDALEHAIRGSVQVAGADSPDDKERAFVDFAEGKLRVLISKPSIAGFGLNFQSCSRMIFCGLSDSYEQFYQAVRRCWRFGQTRPVSVHIVTAETERAVVDNIQRKERDLERMQAGMVEHMRDEMRANLRATKRQTVDYKPKAEMRVPSWLRSEAS